MEIQQCYSLLKKQKKLFWTFQKNRESIVNLFCFDVYNINTKGLNITF